MARRSGLGKGLDALLPSDPPAASGAPPAPPAPAPPPDPAPARVPPSTEAEPSPPGAGTSPAASAGIPDTETLAVDDDRGVLRHIPVNRIRPNRNQPRAVFDDEALESLTASIAELGVLQPILVREVPGSEDVELIAGERRWRASRRAGLEVIPAIIRPIDDTRSLQQALVENVQREDLNPIEEAQAYQQLIDEFSFTQDAVGQAVGRSRSAIANTLRLLHLPPEVQDMVGEGRLSAGHARALLGIDDHDELVALAVRVEQDELSVRETEELVRRSMAPAPPPDDTPPAPTVRPAAVLEVEERLSDHFDTRVHVDLGTRNGKLVVQFADLEDLDRIFSLILLSQPQDEVS